MMTETFTPKPEKTITERFKAHDGNLSRKQIIQFLALENAALSKMAPSGSLSEEQEAEYLEFFHYFSDLYSEDGKLWTMMSENWGDLPLVIRIGMCLEEENAFPYNQEIKLTPQQQKWRDSFVECVFSYRTNRTLTFLVDNPDEDTPASESFCFPKVIPKMDLSAAKEIAGDWFSYALQFGGSLVLRLAGMGNKGKKDVVCGFFFHEGKVHRVPTAEMKKSPRDYA